MNQKRMLYLVHGRTDLCDDTISSQGYTETEIHGRFLVLFRKLQAL